MSAPFAASPRIFPGRLLSSSALAIFCAAAALGGESPPTRSITVIGEGIVDVAPDAFVLTVTVHARDKDLDQALTDATKRSNRVLSAIKEFPLDRARSYTSSYSIRPVYDANRAEIQAHEVSQSLRLVLTDIDRAEAFTTGVIKAGATTVDSIEFVSLKTPDLWQPAREKAVSDALQRATGMARALDHKPGAPRAIKMLENFGNTALGCRWDRLAVVASAGAVADPDRGHFVPPSNIKVQARVEVEFALEPMAAPAKTAQAPAPESGDAVVAR